MKKICLALLSSLIGISISVSSYASGGGGDAHSTKVVKTNYETMYPVKIPTFEGRHLEEGNRYYEQGLYSKAYHEYFMSVRLNPSFWQGFRAIGYVYLKQGKPSKAINNYLKAISIINPTYAAKTLDEGQVALKEGDLYLAIAKFQKVLNIPPEAGKLVDEGVALLSENKKSQAQKKFEEAVKVDTTYDKKRPEGSYADVHFKLGMMNYDKKKYPDAIKDLEWAVKLDPIEYGYQYSLGNAYFKLAFKNKKKVDSDLLKKAMKSYERAYTFNPRDPELMYNLAVTKVEEASLYKQDVESKAEEISLIIDGDPKAKKSKKKKDEEPMKIDVKKKLADDRKVLEIDAKAKKINSFAVKNAKQAVDLLEKATMINPLDPNFYSYLGDAYAMVGEKPEHFIRAAQAYQKSIDLDSKNANLYAKMGASYYLASKIYPSTEDLPITQENSKLYNKFGKKFYKAEMLSNARDSFNAYFASASNTKSNVRAYLSTVENEIANLGFRIPDKNTGR